MNWTPALTSRIFSLSEHLEKLSKRGDAPKELDATVDFEYFRGLLVAGLGYGDGCKGGRRLQGAYPRPLQKRILGPRY